MVPEYGVGFADTQFHASVTPPVAVSSGYGTAPAGNASSNQTVLLVPMGHSCLNRATAPDTCAAAIEVPKPPANPPPGTEEVMKPPGASRFRNGAPSENCNTASSGATVELPPPKAPTLTADEMQAGKPIASVKPSFPDPMTVGILADLSRFMASVISSDSES